MNDARANPNPQPAKAQVSKKVDAVAQTGEDEVRALIPAKNELDEVREDNPEEAPLETGGAMDEINLATSALIPKVMEITKCPHT